MMVKKASVIFKICMLLLLVCLSTTSLAQANPLSAEKAFQLKKVYADNNHQLVLEWKVQPGYYLYHDRFQFTVLNPPNVKLGPALFPQHFIFKTYPDGKKMRAYSGLFTTLLPIKATQGSHPTIKLHIEYQGCSELGICYPLQSKTVTFNWSTPLATVTNDKAVTPPSQQTYLTGLLQQAHFGVIIAVFFGLGLLLALTPCVLPMIPILSSIIMGQKHITHARALGLSMAYVFGTAITYAALGLAVGLLGSHVQAILQQPWIIILFTLLITLMAFSLFGFFNLQLPESLRHRVAKISEQQKHGHYFGSFIMGILSTLILSPCVTPALATAILYIADKGDATLGATALFSMGVGMGVPLLIIGASSTRLLPKAGHWMNAIKLFLGFLMLGVAIWTLSRLLPGQINMLLWAALAISIAIGLRAFQSTHTQLQHIGKGIGLLLFVYAVLLTIGAFTGQTNPLHPITMTDEKKSSLHFQRVVSLSELKKELRIAKQLHKPVLLDFFADWCVECHKMDAYTFNNPKVQTLLNAYVLIRADVTADSPQSRLLQNYYGVVAPPTLLFFTAQGEEVKDHRIIGAVSADQLVAQLKILP